jgi:selenocysteine-specific elongation factor
MWRSRCCPRRAHCANAPAIHLHSYTAETVALVNLLGEKELAPGAVLHAQLRTAAPLALVPGDRFIVRQFSPVVTIGGGVVLDAAPLGRGWLAPRLNALAAALTREGKLRQCGATLVSSVGFESACSSVLAQLKSFHDANRLVAGLGKRELQEKVALPAEVFEGALAALAREKKIEAAGETVRLAGRGVAMHSDESEGKQRIEQAFASAGLKVPSLSEVLAGLKLDRARAQQLVTLLLREGTLVKLADDLVFHRASLDALREQVRALKATTPAINVAGFKELAGISRKYAIPLLEYLDRERVTRRSGEERTIL